jgi:hypothetical protein
VSTLAETNNREKGTTGDDEHGSLQVFQAVHAENEAHSHLDLLKAHCFAGKRRAVASTVLLFLPEFPARCDVLATARPYPNRYDSPFTKWYWPQGLPALFPFHR